VDHQNAPEHPAAGVRKRPRLTAIIVNYESWPDVLGLTASLAAEPEFASGRFEIVVVDNASQGPVPKEFSLDRVGQRVVFRPNNAGFAAGVNAGWRVAQSPWLLVLNPDVEVASGFVGQVFNRLDRYERHSHGPPGIVGFRIQNPDGSAQGSVGIFPNLARTIREQFIPRSRRKYQPGSRIRAGQVDWVTGACMLLSNPMLAQLGGMDEDFFLYHEEVALSREAHKLGWRVEFDPTVALTHRNPLQNRPISPMMRVITRHSKLLYFRKHVSRWQFESLAAIVALEAAIKGFWSQSCRRPQETRAWRLIAEIARAMRAGRGPHGPAVLDLARTVADPPAPPPQAWRGTTCTDASHPPKRSRPRSAKPAHPIDLPMP
jgi:N-acetylglucosaminyl-diphospho-decaprenol L-rhamnosyltransferase